MDTVDFKWKFVESSLLLLQEQTDKINAAARAVMLDPGSPLWEPSYIVGNRLLEALSELVDDSFSSISWYANECDFGREAMDAGCDGNIKKISTIEDLRWLVELNCEN